MQYKSRSVSSRQAQAFSWKRPFALFLIAGILSGCAQQGFVRDTGMKLGLVASEPATASFVRDARPASTEYLAVGVRPPARSPPKTVAVVDAEKKALDAARARNEAATAEVKRLGEETGVKN